MFWLVWLSFGGVRVRVSGGCTEGKEEKEEKEVWAIYNRESMSLCYGKPQIVTKRTMC